MIEKVAVASDDEVTIAPHFGRTRGFVVFDIEDKKPIRMAYLPNTFTGHVRGMNGTGHGSGHHHSILEALRDCKAVISQGMGRRIYADLKKAGINVYVTSETQIENAIDLYVKGRLFDEPGRPCSHSDECRDK
ncbi:MAG: iron-molybdenum cofactor biosynthesis protein [candidate division WOR-3 bacterium]|nr:MAG: iron-molybdenum cofactor biosynthesis protein [candidate division WOR-3 bacterium]